MKRFTSIETQQTFDSLESSCTYLEFSRTSRTAIKPGSGRIRRTRCLGIYSALDGREVTSQFNGKLTVVYKVSATSQLLALLSTPTPLATPPSHPSHSAPPPAHLLLSLIKLLLCLPPPNPKSAQSSHFSHSPFLTPFSHSPIPLFLIPDGKRKRRLTPCLLSSILSPSASLAAEARVLIGTLESLATPMLR
jgi:hypothetical protein